MCEAIDTGLEQLGNVLRGIVDDYLQLKGNRERQDECLRKLEEQYDKIRSSYEQLQKKGLAEYGYVNLYDVKKNFRLSYESFNELLNSYYTAYRHIEIILFSNTVSSIDMRRRFLVDGNSVLKIRIIKKS